MKPADEGTPALDPRVLYDAIGKALHHAFHAGINACGDVRGKVDWATVQEEGRTMILAALPSVPSATTTDTCTGCGSHRIAAITTVIQGNIACCPDCSTLSMGERNTIRSVVAALSRPTGDTNG